MFDSFFELLRPFLSRVPISRILSIHQEPIGYRMVLAAENNTGGAARYRIEIAVKEGRGNPGPSLSLWRTSGSFRKGNFKWHRKLPFLVRKASAWCRSRLEAAQR